MRRIAVKFCGMTRLEDVAEASRLGVDAVGFSFWPRSPRAVTAELARSLAAALPPWTARVGVFVDVPARSIREVAEYVGLSAVQLHGDEKPELLAALDPIPAYKAFRVGAGFDADRLRAFPCGTFLLDGFSRAAPGGTGRSFDWTIARELARFGRIVVAGGLDPDNVGEAVATARPWGVDVASGIESAPGDKDPDRMAAFVEAVRRAERTA